jgi:hypothetical protein
MAPMQHHTRFPDGVRQGPGRAGGRKCSVCSLPGNGRAVVEAEFSTGAGVRRVWQAVGQSMGLSESAVTRHKRYHMGDFALEVGIDSQDSYLDALSDKARIRRHAVKMADAAAARGDSLSFSRASREADRQDESIARILGIDADDWHQTVGVLTFWQDALRRTIRTRPDFGDEFADAVDFLSDGSGDSVRRLAAAARITQTTTHKETA